MMAKELKGSLTALVTPFTEDGVDMKALEKLIERQLDAGTHGLVPLGTTGEAPTITAGEFKSVLKQVVSVAADKVPIIAGVGSNNTSKSVEMAVEAESLGVSHLMVVAPYYNKPTPEGQFQHLKAVHDATSLPVILYNIPGRSVIDISVETMKRMQKHLPRFVGLKDATGNLDRVREQREALGKGFIQLCGEDALAVAFNTLGGRGCISVTANVAPKMCKEMQGLMLKGDFDKALEIQNRLQPLHDALFMETSPGPVKYVLSRLGLIENRLRLPMVPVGDKTAADLDRILEVFGLSELA